VMVDGKFVMRERRMVAFDEEKIVEKANAVAMDLVSR
jgi:hypothetical protein